MKAYLKPIIKYLVYFMMVGGIALLMQLPNLAGQFTEDSFPLGMVIMLIGMFGFWIVFFLTKFDWYDDAEYFDINVIYWIALICTGVLSAIQIYIRVSYGFYNFFNLQFLIPDYESIEKYQSYLIIINFILSGVLGFCFFTMRLSGQDVGYKYIEKTTYYTESGFAYDEKYSGEIIAVGGYILWGLLSAIIPFALTLSPLIIIAFVYFLFKILKHKSKKALKIKYAIAVILTSLFIVPTLLNTFGLPINIPTTAMIVTENGVVVDVMNKTTADRLVLDGARVENNILKKLTVTYAEVPAENVKDLPETIEVLKVTCGYKIENEYYECKLKNLKKVIIDDSVKEIGDNAFNGCTLLEEVKLSKTLTTIGNSAFYNCANIKELSLPNSLEKIGDNAFWGLQNLTLNKYENGFYLGNEENKYLVYFKIDENDAKSAKIHRDTAFIYSNAFMVPYDGSSLLEYDKCPLEEVIFESDSTLKQICADAFFDSNITNIEIPSSVKIIGNSAFASCKNLKSVTVTNLQTLGSSAFVSCKSLEKVEIGGIFTNIQSQCFAGCDALTTVILPGTVGVISNNALSHSEKVKLYLKGAYKKFQVSDKPWFDTPDEVSKKVYFYSEEKPKEGYNAWHYADDNETILIW